MKRMLWLLVLVLAACTEAPEDISKLEGYWQIERVIAPDDTEREYPFSLKLDYFKVRDSTGEKFRVSVKDKNEFVSDRTGVPFTFYREDGQSYLKFAKGESAYIQEISKLDNEQLVLVHENGVKYQYRRFENDE